MPGSIISLWTAMLLKFPFYRWGNCCSDRLSNLPNGTRLSQEGSGVWTRLSSTRTYVLTYYRVCFPSWPFIKIQKQPVNRQSLLEQGQAPTLWSKWGRGGRSGEPRQWTDPRCRLLLHFPREQQVWLSEHMHSLVWQPQGDRGQFAVTSGIGALTSWVLRKQILPDQETA